MKIAILGSGYVGTVTGACFAELGHEVVCTDRKEERMKTMQTGVVPFHEVGLAPLIEKNLERKRLRFTPDIKEAIAEADVVFMCLGYENLPDGKPDFKPLQKAAKDIAAAMTSYKLIVKKSTMPVKTGDWLKSLVQKELGERGVPFDIAVVPQFLREGNAVQDFMHPDRVVIGADSEKAVDILKELYKPLNAELLITDYNSAEMIKHATNAFLAMKISFINAIAQVCEKTGADITEVSKGLGMDKRISPDFLNAGLGYGGIFFPKDIASLVNIANEYHINLDLLKVTETINRYQRISFIERIYQSLGKTEGKTVAIWGLPFRPGTDDMRDAPSVTVIRGLTNRGANIRAYDPLAMPATREILPDITYAEDVYEVSKGADVIAIVTDWPEFASVDFDKLKEVSACRTIVDGRNLYDPSVMEAKGFTYISMGRRWVVQPKEAAKKPAKV